MAPVLSPLRSSPLRVSWARNEKDLLRAQRLRALAFGFSPPDTPEHLVIPEQDRFDPFARHLIVTDTNREICVGTYRILDYRGAQRAGGFYTATEFDISPLSPFLEHTAELGRSAVHPDYRSGGVIALLWAALARILMKEEIRYLMGCASCDLTDPSLDLDRIYTYLRTQAWGEDSLMVFPYRHYPCLFRPGQEASPPVLPPLLKGYVRLGAKILGEASHDPVFQTATFPSGSRWERPRDGMPDTFSDRAGLIETQFPHEDRPVISPPRPPPSWKRSWFSGLSGGNPYCRILPFSSRKTEPLP